MAQLNEGDWVEGAPQWWWKYVIPNPASFWQAVLSIVAMEPDPHPWLQRVTGGVLEGVAMLHAASRVDEATAGRLKSEASEKIRQSLEAVE